MPRAMPPPSSARQFRLGRCAGCRSPSNAQQPNSPRFDRMRQRKPLSLRRRSVSMPRGELPVLGGAVLHPRVSGGFGRLQGCASRVVGGRLLDAAVPARGDGGARRGLAGVRDLGVEVHLDGVVESAVSRSVLHRSIPCCSAVTRSFSAGRPTSTVSGMLREPSGAPLPRPVVADGRDRPGQGWRYPLRLATPFPAAPRMIPRMLFRLFVKPLYEVRRTAPGVSGGPLPHQGGKRLGAATRRRYGGLFRSFRLRLPLRAGPPPAGPSHAADLPAAHTPARHGPLPPHGAPSPPLLRQPGPHPGNRRRPTASGLVVVTPFLPKRPLRPSRHGPRHVLPERTRRGTRLLPRDVLFSETGIRLPSCSARPRLPLARAEQDLKSLPKQGKRHGPACRGWSATDRSRLLPTKLVTFTPGETSHRRHKFTRKT